MNIILFGPPGIGKSTVIGKLKTLGAKAIDLEDLYPNRLRFQIPNLVSNTFIGAADLNPKRKYSKALKILLHADQSVYDARRKGRDASQPGKASQAKHLISDWLTPDTFDLEINTTYCNADELALHLLRLFEMEGWKDA